MLEKSELIIAQEFLPTEYDWRIGVLEHKPLFVCRYYMAKKHWQIIRRDRAGRKHEGRADTLSVEQVPQEMIRLALKATRPIGSGFYGVDIKQIKDKFYVIEVNDNPNVDMGVEDALLKNELYLEIMRVFRRRIEQRIHR
jgi:glutathione synthase/RimK-type ligase-like ATP-grasp enzyme